MPKKTLLVVATKKSITQEQRNDKANRRRLLQAAKAKMLAARQAFKDFEGLGESDGSRAEHKRLFMALNDAVDEYLCLSLPDAGKYEDA